MTDAKAVVDIAVRKAGELLRKIGVVRLLSGVKAEVLKQQDLTMSLRSNDGSHVLADTVLDEDDLGSPTAARRSATGAGWLSTRCPLGRPR